MFGDARKEKPFGKSVGFMEKGMLVDFIDNNDKAQRMGYSLLADKDWDDWMSKSKRSWSSIATSACGDALTLFAVSPYQLPGRILRSMVPPVLDRFRVIHVDLLGPALAQVLLMFIVVFGQANKEHSLEAERAILVFCNVFPILTYILLRCCQAAITFLQLLSLMGYSLFGPVFTLSVSLLIDHEKSNAIFFCCMAVFGGLTTLRVVLVILASLRSPAARLLMCSSVALAQLLFVVSVHFAYMHPTFVYGSARSKPHVH